MFDEYLEKDKELNIQEDLDNNVKKHSIVLAKKEYSFYSHKFT